MDCDSEFNALVSMYQSVVQDMKLSYPAWENVSQKALKLSSQLKATIVCMNAFVDAIQSVGDVANNLKGATRDVGACLTRVCMRQRSIENRLRGLADSLTDELAMSLQSKCAHWKQRVTEMDRAASKFCRKVRSRKGAIEASSVAEQRQICHALLTEQRNQLSFFVSALLPVLNSGLCVLEESSHVRQVTEHLQNTVRSVDSESLIETILGDIHQGSDYSWRNCLSSNANRASFGYSGDEVSLRAPSPSTNTFTWPNSLEGGPRGTSLMGSHTISVLEQPRRGLVSAQTFSPPSPSLSLKKPPLPKRNVSNSSSASSVIPDFSETPPDQILMSHRNGGVQYSSSTDLSRDATMRRPSRPLSFACDELSGPRRVLPSSICRQVMPGSQLTRVPSPQSEYRSSALIAETLQQIDKLGSELDSYCKTNTSAVTISQQTVRLRSGSCKPPPPPERRNSTITAATPTAPSVAEMRAAGTASSEYASSVASSSDLTRDQFSSRFL